MSVEKKHLNDLRVVDLKRELEKRGLDKGGVKALLIERLSKALEDEGLSPDTHMFELDEGRVSGKDDLDKSASNAEETSDTGGSESQNQGEEGTAASGDPENSETNNTDDDALITLNGVEDTELLGNDEEQDQNEAPEADDGEGQDDNADQDDTKDLPEEYLSVHDEDGPDFTAVDDAENETATSDDKADGGAQEHQVLGDSTKGTGQDDGGTTKEGQDGGKEDKKAESGVEGETKNETKEGITATEAGHDQPSGADGEKKKDGKPGAGANLWVSNLSSFTKATDLKRLFSRHGKLVGAKIVTSARTPGAKCYGYITMANMDDADRCIEFLHRVELHGRLISVERAKDDATGPLRDRQRNPPITNSTPRDDRERKSKSRTDPVGGPRHSPIKHPHSDVLSFAKIKEERERQRRREAERRAREVAKMRRDQEEEHRQRERQRRQRMEAERLEKEKTRLRMEREKLEREKAELLRLERERQRLERERLEREREEIRNRKKRLEERPPARAIKRPADDKRAEYGGKRAPADKNDLMLEPPPPPRFTDPDRARDRSRRDDKRPTARRDEFRHSPQGHARYSREKERRSGKEESSRDTRPTSRYESSKDKNWQGNGSQYKTSYSSNSGSASGGGSGGYSSRDVWAAQRQDWVPADASGRWPTETEQMSARSYPAALYGSSTYAQPSPPGVAPPRYSDPRFDAYAHSMPVRKY